MAGLVPFNRKNNNIARADTGFDTLYNMLDDFFNDSFIPSRNLLRDTFKIDIKETDKEYQIEAEIPGVKKEEINLDVENDELCISINRTEEVNDEGKNYIHRERSVNSMSRRIRLANAALDEIKAKLEEGILRITIPKYDKSANSRKIEIE